MSRSGKYSIAVFPGDGIGDEIMRPCVELLDRACARVGDLTLTTANILAGARAYQELGSALPESSIDAAREADAILLAAMGDPAIRYADGTELTPQIDLRFELGLYAGIRPIRSIPGVVSPLSDPRAKDIDFVLVRESIEGLFAPQGKAEVIADREARETLVITREYRRNYSRQVLIWRKLVDEREKTTRPTCLASPVLTRQTCFQHLPFSERFFMKLPSTMISPPTMPMSTSCH